MNYDLHGKLAARTWAALHLELGGGRGALELCPWYFAWCKRVTLQPTERLKVPLALRLGATLDGERTRTSRQQSSGEPQPTQHHPRPPRPTTGAPHIEVGVQNKLIALPLAAVLLAAGKQLHVRHKEGGLAFAFVLPNRGRTHGHEGQVHAEVHGNVKRGGPAGVMLDLEELNCVLRAVQQR